MNAKRVRALEKARARALGLYVVDTGRAPLGWFAQVLSLDGREATSTRCETEATAISAAIDRAAELGFIPFPLLFCQTVRLGAGQHRAIAPERN